MDDSNFRTKMRSNLCAGINMDFAGREVALCGWVNKRRDHGKLIFIDLRDFSGLMQLVFDPKHNEIAHHNAKEIRNEYVLRVTGKVRKRSEETINNSIPTGEIEILVDEMEILSKSETPPFMIDQREKVEENTRLKYRYIDLRTQQMQENLRLRHRITSSTREYFNSKGFVEIETPILGKSTPEGARDFLVPSRLNPGKFYALPQSPQLFKQILMFSGFDRCYQVARCFRDEDLRADRQPEFTQIDLEMTFVKIDDVIGIIEGLFKKIFKDVMGVELSIPFKRLSWKESMEKYGSDKPDLRFKLPIKDISGIFNESNIKIFKSVIENMGCIKCLVLTDNNAENITRKDLDGLVELSKSCGAGGLAWLRVTEGMGMQSPISKFLSVKEKQDLISNLGLKEKDIVLIVADDFITSCSTLGTIRKYLGEKTGLIKENEFNFTWVCDFPLFEWDKRESKVSPMHHPFTKPTDDTIKFLDKEPLKAISEAYDIVLNGQEIGGGSIRINEPVLQKKIFRLLGIDERKIEENFGFFNRALKYGVPPHGGIALGMDRLSMILGRLDSIREVIAFPKTQSAVCMMTESPSGVSRKQLDEVYIETVKTDD